MRDAGRPLLFVKSAMFMNLRTVGVTRNLYAVKLEHISQDLNTLARLIFSVWNNLNRARLVFSSDNSRKIINSNVDSDPLMKHDVIRKKVININSSLAI